MTLFKVYLCSGHRSEDKKGGVDRSSTVIAKDPEGKQTLYLPTFFYYLSVRLNVYTHHTQLLLLYLFHYMLKLTQQHVLLLIA